MAERLHIRRSYQLEGPTRWAFWCAVRVTERGQSIVASTDPLPVPPADRPHEKWSLAPTRGLQLPNVARFEYERRLAAAGHALVRRMESEGWEAGERNAQGMVVRMTRS